MNFCDAYNWQQKTDWLIVSFGNEEATGIGSWTEAERHRLRRYVSRSTRFIKLILGYQVPINFSSLVICTYILYIKIKRNFLVQTTRCAGGEVLKRPIRYHVYCKNRSCGVYSCRLDCCKSLLYGLPDTLLRRLQSVQNATARLITGTRRSDHISPVLRELYWLPIRERV